MPIGRVRGQDGRGAALVLTQRADVPHGSGDQPKLVFEKDGSQYVLSSLFDPGIRYELEVLKPRPRGEPARTVAATY